MSGREGSPLLDARRHDARAYASSKHSVSFGHRDLGGAALGDSPTPPSPNGEGLTGFNLALAILLN